jgi:hypothetical protein
MIGKSTVKVCYIHAMKIEDIEYDSIIVTQVLNLFLHIFIPSCPDIHALVTKMRLGSAGLGFCSLGLQRQCRGLTGDEDACAKTRAFL